MKKTALVLLLLAFALLCTAACAEIYVLDPIYASIDIPEGYVVLTPNNLSSYESWLSAKNKDVDVVQADFEKRGVLLQAWDTENSRVFELRANQDEDTLLAFDVDEQNETYRRSYRFSHYPNNELSGYDFSTAEWKKLDGNRFLVLKYIRRDGGEILYRGFMRRSIQNGYEIDLDLQVYDRATTGKDNTELNKLWKTFTFIEELPLPAAAKAKINFTSVPDEEVNEASLTLKGTASEGVKFTAVTMGMNSSDPILSYDTVEKDGKFELSVILPKEGVYMITVTAEYQDEVVMEKAFPTITYQRTLLAVNFTTEPATSVSTDEVKFAGTAEAGAAIQVFVNGESVAKKKVNGKGKFAFTVELSDEESNEISLVFTKKNLADRRFTYTVNRRLDDAAMLKQLKAQAKKPSYAKLVKNIDQYEGSILGYNGYIVSITQSGESDYIIQMALAKKSNQYSNYILVTSSEEPGFAVGEKVGFYGTCEGMSLSVSNEEGEESDVNYPCMSLLLFVSLD